MKKKILVVDDETIIIKYAQLRLKNRGYEVETARDGEEAVEKTRTFRPDLILLDVKLPKKNGYEVCREIKAEEDIASTPIIFWTAHDSVDVERHTRELQASDFILKPFDSTELFEKIQRCLNGR